MTAKKAKTNKKASSGKFVFEGKPFVSTPIELAIHQAESEFQRADIEIHGLDHGGPSYQCRVFLNNPDANGQTRLSANARYAGCFNVFGHGTCFGDPGHCEVNAERRTRDLRYGHPLTPAFKRLSVTRTLKNLPKRTKDVTITLVPIIVGGDKECELSDVLHFEKLQLVTYD